MPCVHTQSLHLQLHTSAAYLFVGEEVDDGIIDGAGLGKVHGHGCKQRRDVELRVHHHYHRHHRVGQPANKKRYDHGQDHVDGVIVLQVAGTPTLDLHTPVQLREWKKHI